MKKFLLSISFLLLQVNLTAQWISTNGPYGNAIIRSFAKTDGGIIFGGSYSFGVYKSSDYGSSWVKTSMTDKYIHQLYWSGSALYAGTSDGGYYTPDLGNTWHKITDLSIGQFTSDGNKLFAGSFDGVYISTDNGTSWAPGGLQGKSVYSLLKHGNLLVAGLYSSYHFNAGVYISSDQGASWIRSFDTTFSVRSLISHNSVIFAVGDGIIIRSSDNGASWSQITYTENQLFSIASNGTYLFAGTYNIVPYYPLNKVLRSSDNGATWEIMSESRANHFGIPAMITYGSNLIVSAEQISQTDIYRSPDNGVNWFYGNTGMKYKLIINLTSIGSDLYGCTYSGEVCKSTDNGDSWNEVGQSFFNEKETAVWSLTTEGSTLIAGVGGQGLYRSLNGGADWQFSGLNGHQFERLLYDGTNIFAGSDKGLYLSTDNGAGWTLIGFPDQIIYALAKSGQTLYASVIGDGIQRTDNLGATWIKTTDIYPQIDIGALAAIGSVIYAGTPGYGVYKSTNSGTTWTAVNDGLPGSGGIYVNELTAYGNYLLAGINGSMYQTSPQIVYVLQDGNSTWYDKNAGLIPEVTGITDFYVLNGYLFAGTYIINGQGSYGRSVWRMPVGSVTGAELSDPAVPCEYLLHQNYPNPFNPVTRISFSLPQDSKVKLQIFNGLGEIVSEPVNSEFQAGMQYFDFNAGNLPSGVYFCRMQASAPGEAEFILSRTIRMVLLR